MSTPFPILVVDDDPAIAEVLTRAAQDRFPEAAIIATESFSQAAHYIENLEGTGPRLVLLDIDLETGPDGFAFLSLLRAHPQGRLMPVVMLSSSDNTRQVDRALEQGASFFTRKPFTYQEWKSYVQRLKSYWFETTTLPLVEFKKRAVG